jgi:hypothetical protein
LDFVCQQNPTVEEMIRNGPSIVKFGSVIIIIFQSIF